jgi:predicted alpha/beta-hydrolase family hydrolase
MSDIGGSFTSWSVPVDAAETQAAYLPATSSVELGRIIAGPSAGGHMAEAGMLRLAEVLRAAGLGVVLFDFLYRRRGSRRPDPMPELQRCFAAVAETAGQHLPPAPLLLLGGRSMGGRVATMLAADGFGCDGLLLFAYPLHPAGQPDRLRDRHLRRLSVPTLCFNGTRDALCRRDLMEAAIHSIGPGWTMHWLEGADHGFHVLRSSGRSDADVLAEIREAMSPWLAGLRRPSVPGMTL